MVEDLLRQVRQAATSQVHQEETTGVASLQTTTLRRRPGASGWTFPRGIASSSRIPINKTGTGSCMGGERQAFTGAILYKPAPPPAGGATSGEGVAAKLGEGERCRTGSAGQQPTSAGPGAGHQAATVEGLNTRAAAGPQEGSRQRTPPPFLLQQIAGFPDGRCRPWCARENLEFLPDPGVPRWRPEIRPPPPCLKRGAAVAHAGLGKGFFQCSDRPW